MLECIDLGRMDYASAYEIQQFHWQQCHEHPNVRGVVLLVEHDPVYTLGRKTNPDYLRWSASECQSRGIAQIQSDRGGQVTYHGPGQLVGYPVMRLSRKGGRGVAWFVDRLEALMISVLNDFSIKATRNEMNPGVWVGEEKIGAIGVKVSRGITQHGFSLNVNVDLSHYAGIVPC